MAKEKQLSLHLNSTPQKTPEMSARGFTLMEVMVVLVIMSTLAVFSVEAIQKSLREKSKIQSNIDDVSRIRDSLKIMEKDINLAFHYQDFELEMINLIKEKQKSLRSTTTSSTLPGTPPPAAGLDPANDPRNPLNAPRPNRLDPRTHFLGKENEVFFATMNTGRVAKDVAQADFIKVGYILKDCRRPGVEGESSSCLIRRSSPHVEGKIEEGGKEIILIENVQEFKLRFFGKGKQDWIDSWNSKEGDASVRNKFPDAVEVSLKVGDKSKKQREVSMQLIVPIRFPNNPAPRRNQNPNAPNQPSAGGNP